MSTEIVKEHENSEKITISMLQAEFLTFKNFLMRVIFNINEKIFGNILELRKTKGN